MKKRFTIEKCGDGIIILDDDKTISSIDVIDKLNKLDELEQLQLGGVSSLLQHAGYLFNGRFYKCLDDMRGKTMHEGNMPQPVYFCNNC